MYDASADVGLCVYGFWSGTFWFSFFLFVL